MQTQFKVQRSERARNRILNFRFSNKPEMIYAVGAFLAVLVMCLRIVSTYSVFTQIWDEPFHIACGMEWLDKHEYQYEAQHPPLARIAAAIGPYLIGERSHDLTDPAAEGNAILGDGARYRRTLSLARLGELPFVVLACLGVWAWTRHWFGTKTAFLAVLLFSWLPPVLAHGGFATTDIAVTATCTWALYCFARLLEERTWRTAVQLGVWSGLALISKFTAVLLLPLAIPLIAFIRVAWNHQPMALTGLFPSRMGRMLAVAAAVCILLVWAGYRFTFAPLFRPEELQKRRAEFPAAMSRPGIINTAITRIPVPAGQLFRGLGQVWRHNDAGQESFLLGQRRVSGWWYFFPVVLAVKTPLGFLVLALCGAVAAFRNPGRDWHVLIPPSVALLILLLCLPSRINIGVRHILPIYPLLSITAAFFLMRLIRPLRVPGTIAAGCLVGWCCWATASSGPDYIAYFNELAGGHPESVRVDSDLDWGQDLGRLSQTLRDLHATSVSLAYFGTADLKRFDLPTVSGITCDAPMKGYVAVSLTNLYVMRMALVNPQPTGNNCAQRFEELRRVRPVKRAGTSIVLYHFPAATAALPLHVADSAHGNPTARASGAL